MTLEPYITDTELAARLGKSRWFVQEHCRAKSWPHLRVGKSFRFTAEQVAQIEARLTVKVAPPKAGETNAWGRRGRSA